MWFGNVAMRMYGITRIRKSNNFGFDIRGSPVV